MKKLLRLGAPRDLRPALVRGPGLLRLMVTEVYGPPADTTPPSLVMYLVAR
jgi:hypothetical protein